VPEEVWRELKGAALAAYQAGSPKLAQMAKEDFVGRYECDYPSATSCFLDDFDACIAHLQVPISHRRATRTTNMLERLFGEERRRTKVIPHAFGERAVLKLMYAALDVRPRQVLQHVRRDHTIKSIVGEGERSRILDAHRHFPAGRRVCEPQLVDERRIEVRQHVFIEAVPHIADVQTSARANLEHAREVTVRAECRFRPFMALLEEIASKARIVVLPFVKGKPIAGDTPRSRGRRPCVSRYRS
jgi:hypothetical protein